MRVISLTTIPPRFKYLTATLESLLNQDSVDEVRLYIAKEYRRFPEYDGHFPTVPKGIKICQIEEDLGPASKILPAIKDFKDQDVQILFCDDDLIYHKDWAKKLFDIQKQRPTEAVATYGRNINKECRKPTYKPKQPEAKPILPEKDYLNYRIKRVMSKIFKLPNPLFRPIIKSGYVDILFGVGGVVVKPEFFNEEAFNIPKEAWSVDDIWISAQLEKNGIKIYCPKRLPYPRITKASETNSLLDENEKIANVRRQESNINTIKYCQNKYSIWI
jgi:glycosyltransferase involved in cell wall biosynthesis